MAKCSKPSEVEFIEIRLISIGKDRPTDRGVVKELAGDIAKNGQKKPIIVEKLANGRYKLVDGLHRIEARKLLGQTNVPAAIKKPI